MIKLNLHVHSELSHDSINSLEKFRVQFEVGAIDQVAIADHDEIKFALAALEEFGTERVIVAQEITTIDKTHMIGLFLREFVPKGLSPKRTAELIRAQKGLVYIPHPFDPDTGVGEEVLDELVKLKLIDIIEGFNAWQRFLPPLFLNKSKANNTSAIEFAEANDIPWVAAGDSHTPHTLGTAYTEISEPATRENLLDQLRAVNEEAKVQKYHPLALEDFRAGLGIIKYMLRRGK